MYRFRCKKADGQNTFLSFDTIKIEPKRSIWLNLLFNWLVCSKQEFKKRYFSSTMWEPPQNQPNTIKPLKKHGNKWIDIFFHTCVRSTYHTQAKYYLKVEPFLGGPSKCVHTHTESILNGHFSGQNIHQISREMILYIFFFSTWDAGSRWFRTWSSKSRDRRQKNSNRVILAFFFFLLCRGVDGVLHFKR